MSKKNGIRKLVEISLYYYFGADANLIQLSNRHVYYIQESRCTLKSDLELGQFNSIDLMITQSVITSSSFCLIY